MFWVTEESLSLPQTYIVLLSQMQERKNIQELVYADAQTDPSLRWAHFIIIVIITKTYLYSFDPLKPHFYTVKLGLTGLCIIFRISAQKHRLWILVRTASARRF